MSESVALSFLERFSSGSGTGEKEYPHFARLVSDLFASHVDPATNAPLHSLQELQTAVRECETERASFVEKSLLLTVLRKFASEPLRTNVRRAMAWEALRQPPQKSPAVALGERPSRSAGDAEGFWRAPALAFREEHFQLINMTESQPFPRQALLEYIAERQVLLDELGSQDRPSATSSADTTRTEALRQQKLRDTVESIEQSIAELLDILRRIAVDDDSSRQAAEAQASLLLARAKGMQAKASSLKYNLLEAAYANSNVAAGENGKQEMVLALRKLRTLLLQRSEEQTRIAERVDRQLAEFETAGGKDLRALAEEYARISREIEHTERALREVQQQQLQ